MVWMWRRVARRKWLISVALMALVVVVVCVASLALDATSGRPTARSSSVPRRAATATPALATTALPATATLVPADFIPPAWHQAGPAFAQTVAFAASNPAVGYTCGAQSGTIMVASSVDGGATWSTPVAVDSGYGCAISIDPQQPTTLAMTIQPCSPNGCAPGAATFDALERSGDGGVTWAQAQLPADGNQMGFGDLIAWAGNTLFAQILADAAVVPRHYLAASVAGGGFAWADAAVAFGQPATQLRRLAGRGATLYAGFVQTGVAVTCMAPVLANVIATSDGGQSWSAILFTDQGKPVALSAVSPDGVTLVGVATDGLFVASRDGGQTWQAAPVAPPQTQTCTLLVAADGTFVAQFAATPDAGAQTSLIADAPPGATAWHTLATGASNIALATLLLAPKGSALTLWATTLGNLIPFKLVACQIAG